MVLAGAGHGGRLLSARRTPGKEKLHQAVDELSELEAEQMLDIIARRRQRDPMIAAFEDAPEDDEPFTDEEAAEADEAWKSYKRGEAIPLDQIRHEYE